MSRAQTLWVVVDALGLPDPDRHFKTREAAEYYLEHHGFNPREAFRVVRYKPDETRLGRWIALNKVRARRAGGTKEER